MEIKLPPLDSIPFVKTISADDWMAKGKTPNWYYNRGYQALAVILEEVNRQKTNPKVILDFGCGHGNIARMLKAIFKDAEIVGQDVNQGWLDWCKGELGISVIKSAEKIPDVVVGESLYDLIWVGSVFTHIPLESAQHLFKELVRGLNPGGLLLFTTAGKHVASLFNPEKEKLLEPSEAKAALEAYKKFGYGFVPYKNGKYQNWGRCFTSFEVIHKLSKSSPVTLFTYKEGGWGGYQNLFSYSKHGYL